MRPERLVQALWARLVAARLPRPDAGAPRTARRILLLRHDAVGDMLSSLPVIRALAGAGFEVDVLASPANAGVLLDGTWGVRVLTTAHGRAATRALHRVLAARRYDVVIDGLVLNARVNSRTVRLLRASRAPVRIGTAPRTHDFLYTHRVPVDPGANHVEVLASLVVPLGLAAESALEPVAMPLTPAERAGAAAWWGARDGAARLFVNLSASSADRRWSDGAFERVLRETRESVPALQVAVTGSSADWPAARRVAGRVGARAFTGPLREAFAVLAASDAVLTPDTGVSHAAAGFGVPSVVLMPRGNLRFAPWRAATRLVLGGHRTIHEVSVEAVRDALVGLLHDLATRSRAAATIPDDTA